MKKILLLLGSFVAIGLMVSAWAAGEKQPAPTGSKATVEQLTQQVSSLQAKIKTLEDRLDKLEKAGAVKFMTLPPAIVQPAPNSSQIPGLAGDPNRPPNAWSEREFNGLKYYLVPLGGEGN